MLTRDRIKPAAKGDPTLMVITLPSTVSLLDELDMYALPPELRPGGMLLAVPDQVLSAQCMALGQNGGDEVLFRPISRFHVPLVEEADDLSIVDLGVGADVVVIDVTDDVLAIAREFDPVTDSTAPIHSFSLDFPNSMPDVSQLLTNVRDWLASRQDERSGFFSAQEDQVEPRPPESVPDATPKKANAKTRVTNSMIAEQLSTLVAQMQVLSHHEDVLRNLQPVLQKVLEIRIVDLCSTLLPKSYLQWLQASRTRAASHKQPLRKRWLC